jgi:hypothetical protein
VFVVAPVLTCFVAVAQERDRGDDAEVLHLQSDAGWVTAPLMLDIAKHFVRNLPNLENEPALLLIDGARAHYDWHALQYLSEHNVHCYVFSPNLTHLLCPLDLSVFAAYKAELVKQVAAVGFIQQQPGWVAKLVNASNAAWRAAATPLHIKNGWARSGIFATPEQRAQLFAEWTRGGVNATKEPRALPQPGQLQEVRERLAEYQQQLRDFELKTVLPRHVPRPPLAHRPRGPSAAQPINTELTSADVLAGIRNAATAKAAKAEARRAGVVRPRGRPRKLRPASADSDASAPAVPAPRKRVAASASAPSSDDEDSGGADSLESLGDLFRPTSQRNGGNSDFIYYWYA